ncbi:MAG: HAD-IC family P-type ATPase [Collinsella sp.]|nr:HAD-IC family P-type ATPase [Collinsella sp.]
MSISTSSAQPATHDPKATAPSPDPRKGLTSDEVRDRIDRGLVNVNTELKTKSIRQLVIENTCTLFNFVNVILAALVLTTGAFKNLTFLGVVLLNTSIGIIQSLRSKRMVDRLTLLASKRAIAIRDGVELELELDQIVLDDIIKLGRGDQIPADAIVVEGEAQVNESLLTGESDLIRKVPGSELMSGSFVDSGLVRARVIHVGADNYVAKINNEAKYVKKVNSEIMAALNAIVRFASALMLPLGIALFLSSAHGSYEAVLEAGVQEDFLPWLLLGHAPWGQVAKSILSTVGALIGMIPQGLVLLTSSVLAIATIRLARRNVLAQQLYCIETLARVDVLCLDKTGTITSGRMEVEGVHPLEGADAGAVDFALANIARATSEDANETCRALLDHYAGLDVAASTPSRVVPFSSARKWSGATFPEGSYVMGAAQFVLDADAFARIEGEVSRLTDGCRVLVAAAVDGFDDEGSLIGSARPLGLVAIRDEIRSSAAETIRYFTDQGVELNVISGDDPRTVAAIARHVGIPGSDSFIDATTLDTPAKLDAAVDRYHIFGRVTPQQKRELVVALKRRGHTVAMTGDGVNDVLALKEADCSVAMAAGSDAARNVAEIVLVDNDFASMPAVVAEGRRSINNLQRSAALFLTKTLFSMGLAAICIAFPPYPFEPITMTLINFFCIGFPSFVLALEPNKARIEGSFLTNVLKRALPAALAVIACCSLSMALAALLGLGAGELSLLCLVSTCVMGASLIFRISVPFTPLRVCVLVIVVVGISAGVLLFPSFFSVAPLDWISAPTAALVSAAGSVIFFSLADRLDARTPRALHRASGFGRGVRVSFGRGDMRVSTSDSYMGRIARRASSSLEEHRSRRDLKRAQIGASRSIPADGRRRGGGLKIERAASGIRVKMPARRRRRRD